VGWHVVCIAGLGRSCAGLRPQDPAGRLRREIVKELLAELRMWDRKRKAIHTRLDEELDGYGTTLTEIDGIGRVGAAAILSLAGDVTRFPTPGHFASYAGTAPIAASSGDRVRYRLNRGGKRQLNKVLHTAAKTQQRMSGSPGHAYIRRRVAEGKTVSEAVRALKRHLTNAVYRRLLDDAEARAPGELGSGVRGGHG
jgi:transposase